MAKTKEISAAEEEREPFPRDWSDIRGHAEIIRCLRRLAADGHLPHALIFTGAAGIGKRRTARVLARTLLCAAEGNAPCGRCDDCRTTAAGVHPDYFEVIPEARGKGAAMIRADAVRDILIAASESPQRAGRRIILIDGVHSMNEVAANRLLKTLEEPPHYAIFILATTEKHKILPTILSRCQVYDFARISVSDVVRHLQYVAQKEGVQAEAEALNVIAQKADGGMRDALSIFDQAVSYTGGRVTYKAVIENLNVLDYDYYFRLTDAMLTGDIRTALLILNEILEKGFDGQHIVTGLASHFRDLLVCRDERTLVLLEIGASIREQYRTMAARCSDAWLYQAIDLANECDLHYRESRNKRLLLELTLIQLCQLRDAPETTIAEAKKKSD